MRSFKFRIVSKDLESDYEVAKGIEEDAAREAFEMESKNRWSKQKNGKNQYNN